MAPPGSSHASCSGQGAVIPDTGAPLQQDDR